MSIFAINGKYIWLHTRIPNTIKEWIIAVEIPRVILESIIREVRHRREVDGKLIELDSASSVVYHIEVSKGSSLVLWRSGVCAWLRNMKPQRFVNTWRASASWRINRIVKEILPASAVASQPSPEIHNELSVKLMPMYSPSPEVCPTPNDTRPAMFLLKS